MSSEPVDIKKEPGRGPRYPDLLRDVFAIAVRGGGGLVQIFAILVLGRQFGAEVVGYYGLAFSVLALSGTILALGFPGYLVMKNSVRFHEGEFRLFRGNILHALMMAALAAVVIQIVLGGGIWASWDWFRSHNIGYRILTIAPTTGLLMAMIIILVSSMRARGQPVLANLIERPLLHVLTLAAFFFLFGWIADPDYRVLASIVPSAALLVAFSWKSVTAGLAPATGDVRQHDPVSVPLLGAYLGTVVVYVILARSPLVVGSFFFTAQELGSFQVAFSFAASVIVLQEAVGGVVGPRFAILANQGAVKPLLRLHRLSQLALFLLVAPMLALLLVYPDEIVQFVNAELGSAALPLTILTVGTAVRCACGVYRTIFEATGAAKFGLYAGIVAVVVLIVGIMLLSDRGAVGLAIAWSAATIAHAITGYVLCEYVLRVWVPRNAGGV